MLDVAISRHLFPFEVAIESKSQRRDLQFPVKCGGIFQGGKEQKIYFKSKCLWLIVYSIREIYPPTEDKSLTCVRGRM